MTIPDKTDEDRDGLIVDKPLNVVALEVVNFGDNEALMVDELNIDWLEDNEGLIVGSPTVDRIEVREGLSVWSFGYTLEGAGADAVERAACSWHFPLVIKTSSMAMWLKVDPAIPSNVT